MCQKTQSLTPQLVHHAVVAPKTAGEQHTATVFSRGHRKTHSLGNPAAFLYTNQSFCHNIEDDDFLLKDIDRLNLLDDSLRDFSSTTCTTSTLSSTYRDGGGAMAAAFVNDSGHETSDEHASTSAVVPFFVGDLQDGDVADDTDDECLEAETETLCHAESAEFTKEGPVRRRTQLKAGKPPRVSSWCRYWICLWGTNLLYFATKSLPSRNYELRSAFKSKPMKVVSVSGWMAFLSNDPLHADIFQLQEPSRGDVYKFRAGSLSNAIEWVSCLKAASEKHRQKLPDNLMSFD